MKKNRIYPAIAAIAVLLTMAFVFSCGNDDDPKEKTDPKVRAFIQAVNALPSVEAVQISDEDAVNAALALYSDLSNSQRGLTEVQTAKTKLDELVDKIEEMKTEAAKAEAFVDIMLPLPSAAADVRYKHIADIETAAVLYDALSAENKALASVVAGKTKLDVLTPTIANFTKLPTRSIIENLNPRFIHPYSSNIGVDVGYDSLYNTGLTAGAADQGADYRPSTWLSRDQRTDSKGAHVIGLQFAVYRSVATNGVETAQALQDQITAGTVTPLGYFWAICGHENDPNGFAHNNGSVVRSFDPKDPNSGPNRADPSPFTPAVAGDRAITGFRLNNPLGASFTSIIKEFDTGWTSDREYYRLAGRYVADPESAEYRTADWSAVSLNFLQLDY